MAATFNFPRCHQYYPTSGDELLQFGDFECKLTDEESREHYVVRNIELRDVSSSTSSLRVKHFQFVNWPDFGVRQIRGKVLGKLTITVNVI